MTTKKKYTLTDEHHAQLKPWAERWIKNAMRTRPMDDEDRRLTREAIVGMYAAAGKPAPIVVFVPSPFVAAFASGFAASIWHKRKGSGADATHAATDDATDVATDDATYAATHDATYAATHDATRAATYDATDVATYDATHDATYAATHAATHDATHAATHAATHDATRDATHAATYDATRDATHAATHAATHDATLDATHAATYDATLDATHAATHAATHDATDVATDDATHDATRAATDVATRAADLSKWFVVPGDMVAVARSLGVGEFGLGCAALSWKFRSGGNQWSGYDSFFSFFRHVAKLDIDYSKWAHWETASEHSGPRYVHEKFCIISDFPSTLKVDEQNRPHAESGPFCEWADGSRLYSWHGARVAAEWIEHKKTLDPKTALTHGNVELRRAAAEIIGWAKVLEHVSAKTIDKDKDPEIGELLEADLPDSNGSRFLRVHCGTGRDFVLPVPAEMKTARQANAWTYDIPATQLKPEVRT